MTLLRRLDREQKVVGGILVAIGVLVFAFMGMSRDASGGALSFEPAPQGDSQASSDAASPEAQKSGNTPPTGSSPDKASTPRTQPAGQAKALTQAPMPADPARKAPDTTAGPQQKTASPEEKTASPQEKTASPHVKREPDKAPARVRPEAKPTPSPELTSARVRSLPAGTTLVSAVAALGQPLTTAELRGTYGARPIQLLLGQHPAGSACRYYGLAPGEPAPLVRLCFAANGFLLTREFVAPPPKA